MSEVLFNIDGLTKKFSSSKSIFNTKNVHETLALDKITFDIYAGETLGIVGESGSGKSTLAKILTLLEEPTGGQVVYNGLKEPLNIHEANSHEIYLYRQNVQMIFQDPYSSLNPMHLIKDILEAPMKKRVSSKQERYRIMRKALEVVGLPQDFLYCYPHELSGGQRQRVNIARVLGLQPKVIIFDESTSALDVSVQAQILNLIKQIQAEFNMTFLFISHDLGVVEYLSNRILVLYQGQLLEILEDTPLSAHATHPYTKKLIQAVPNMDIVYIEN